MSTKKKENIVIYGSLIAAIVCLCFGAIDYFNNVTDSNSLKNEVKEALKEFNGNKKTETKKVEEEPSELTSLDKKNIINNYLNSILDQKIKDEFLTYQTVKSWGNYEITSTTYQKKIMENYYSYTANIKIFNTDPILPTVKNDSLSTKEYIIITLTFNLLKENNQDNYNVKSVTT